MRWSSAGRLPREQTLSAPAMLIVGRPAARRRSEAGAEFRQNVEERQSERTVCGT